MKNLMTKRSRIIFWFLLLGASISAIAQTHRPGDFGERYTLKQVVVLSRHNIRSPLSLRQSALQRITPHEWHHWSSAPSELSLRGGALETIMGSAILNKWSVSSPRERPTWFIWLANCWLIRSIRRRCIFFFLKNGFK